MLAGCFRFLGRAQFWSCDWQGEQYPNGKRTQGIFSDDFTGPHCDMWMAQQLVIFAEVASMPSNT